MSTNPQDGSRPAVVLVHGAFAESASWNGVIRRLQVQGYTAIAAANPLRSLSGGLESRSWHRSLLRVLLLSEPFKTLTRDG
jgi:hypothetical protein